MEKDKIITIVGLGLMGGSFAMGLHHLGYKVYGYDIDAESIKWAYDNKIILNEKATDEVIQKADFIILGLYPKVIVNWVKEHKHLFKDNVLITDLTGIKSNVVEQIQNEMEKEQEFIASHPMCGRETSGVKTANTEMFAKANYIIVPTNRNKMDSVFTIRALAEEMGFYNVEVLSVKEHDQMISFLSQLPHVIAVALMDCRNNDHLARYTGDSFRDLTRIAKINPELWSELFIANKENLVKDIDSFVVTMNELKDMIEKEDKDGLHRMFVESKKRRLNFEKR